MFELNQLKFKHILRMSQLTIKAGKIYCLFGESGSGKSTLLKMFNGMLTPDNGDILYQGKSIQELDPITLRQEVVMLAQDPVVFEGTIRDNLVIGLTFSNQDIPENTILEGLLQDFQLSKDLAADAADLSGGEKQRLAFARVLLMDANVYLLDEPTSALDEATETSVMDLFVQRMKQKNKTAIMVTHSHKVAENYSDQILYMKNILST